MTFCAQLLIALVAIMAKLPPSFNTQVHKYGERLTMNNIKRWTIDQIIEYNEFNHDNAQVQIVKYKCGAIGQKVGTKTHAKKCRNGCDVNDLTIRFMDNENNSWKDEEKYKGFAKGAGSKRQRKKQVDPKQRTLDLMMYLVMYMMMDVLVMIWIRWSHGMMYI
eukprot:256277_1